MYRVITGSFSLRRVALVLVEHALIVLAVVVAAVIRLGFPENATEAYTDWVMRSVVVAAVLQVCLHYSDLYDMRTLSDRRDLLIGLLRSLGAASVILAILYYWIPHLGLGRGVFALATLLIIGLVAGWRIAFEWLSLRGHSERLLIVGTGVAAVNLARELFERRSELGVELVGFVDSDPAMVGTPLIYPGVIGTVKDTGWRRRTTHAEAAKEPLGRPVGGTDSQRRASPVATSSAPGIAAMCAAMAVAASR